jgi:hypothetical protein
MPNVDSAESTREARHVRHTATWRNVRALRSPEPKFRLSAVEEHSRPMLDDNFPLAIEIGRIFRIESIEKRINGTRLGY